MVRWRYRQYPLRKLAIMNTRASCWMRNSDDFSPSGIEAARKFAAGFHDRLAAIDQQALSAEERADYQIIENAIELSLLDLQQIQSYRHNPTIYVELVGNALFSPFVLEYAPLDTRYRQLFSGFRRRLF